MKRRLAAALFCVLSLVLLCAGCTGSEPSGAAAAVETVMKGIVALDDSSFTACVKDYTGESSINVMKNTLRSDEFLSAAVRRLRYEIRPVSEDETTARVEVTVTNADFASFVDEYYRVLVERLSDETVLSEQPNASATGLLNEFVDRAELVTKTVTVSLVKTQGNWVLDSAGNLVAAALDNAMVSFITMGR